MNVVDSSGWLEYFTDGKNADFFAPAIEDSANLVVPSLSLYEVFKIILQQRGEGDALQAVAVMIQSTVVDLDADLALSAAKVAVDFKLPMADSIMLSTAQAYGAVLWTQDAHFQSLENVRYFPRP